MRRTRRTDAGETLVEILIAIVIIGITATGLIAGLSTSIFTTDAHRRLSQGETLLRAYGELIKEAVLHPPSTVTTADMAVFNEGDTITISVTSTSEFTDPLPFSISLDGIKVTAQSKTATSFTGKALAGGSALAGARVARYESCPSVTVNGAGTASSGYFDKVLTAHPELTTADRLDKPFVTAIAYYDRSNAAVTCATFHNDPGMSSCYLTGSWRTDCDPPWMRVSTKIISKDTGRSKAVLTSDIIIRRTK